MYSKDSIYKVYKRGISKDIPNRDEILRYWKEGFGDEEIKIDCYSKFPSDQLVDFELKEVEE